MTPSDARNQFFQHQEQLAQTGVAASDLPFLYEVDNAPWGILLLHGSAASACNSRALGTALQAQGYTVLGSLLAGHGHPERLYQGEVSWLDCYRSAAADFQRLRALVPRIAIAGSSFGGSLAYLLGLEYPLDAIIALSAPALTSGRYRPPTPWMEQVTSCIHNVEQRIHQLQVPTLILHGSDDPFVKVKNAFYAYEQIGTPYKKLGIYNRIGHSLGFGFNTAEVARDITSFLHSCQPPVWVRFALPDRGYRSVHVAGDFTNWDGQMLPMERQGAEWVRSVPLERGSHQYKFVIDGYDWVLDPTGKQITVPHGKYNSVVDVS